MLWACASAGASENVSLLQERIDSIKYQQVLEENLTVSLKNPRTKRARLLHRDNDPEHTSKCTMDHLRRCKLKVSTWSLQYHQKPARKMRVLRVRQLQGEMSRGVKIPWTRTGRLWAATTGCDTDHTGCTYFCFRAFFSFICFCFFFLTVTDGNKNVLLIQILIKYVLWLYAFWTFSSSSAHWTTQRNRTFWLGVHKLLHDILSVTG